MPGPTLAISDRAKPASRRRTAVRVVFWCYAALVFSLTHWPDWHPQVPGIERPDLYAHLGVFGLWFTLFWLTGYAAVRGTVLSLASVAVAAVVACLYAAADELLQGIPSLHRTVALDDYAANCTGIAIAATGASVLVLFLRRRHLRSADERP